MWSAVLVGIVAAAYAAQFELSMPASASPSAPSQSAAPPTGATTQGSAPAAPAPTAPAPSAPAQGAAPSSSPAPAGGLGSLSLAPDDNAPAASGPTIATPTAPAAPQIVGTIRALVIQGNQNISEAAIRSVLTQKVGDAYSDNGAEADRQAIQDLGYFGAVTDRASIGPGPSDVTVTYTVVEYPKVTRIVFTGNEVEPTAKLMAVMQIKAGQVLNTNTVARDIQAIMNVYQTDGYRADISEEINMDPTSGILTMPVIEAKVSSITITGNRKTKSFVITREMKTRVGRPYNEIQFRKDLTKVYNLGLFDSVGQADISTPEVGEVAISIPVKEKQTGQVSVSVGYSTLEQLVGRAQLSDTNFRGMGESANVSWEVAGTQAQESVEVGFGDPYIDKRHDGFNIDLYNRAIYRFSSSFISQATSGETDEYYERHIGGSLTLSRPLNDTTTGFVTARSESVRSNDVSIPIVDSFIRQDATVSGLGYRWEDNTRDNEFNPAAGGFYSLSVEGVATNESTVGNAPTPLAPGDHNFIKYGFDLRRYISLQGPRRKSLTEPKRVLAFRLLGGFTSSEIPFSEEYFLGGADSLRGYVEDRFWGNDLLLLNSELRIPMGSSLTGVLFTDVGDAWGTIYQGAGLQQSTDFSAEAAVGVGVRVNTPIGPIRLDYGYGRQGGQTDFSIGQSF
jgi:outer membrane protein insertion porin family